MTTNYCRGKKDSGEPCDCEEYSPPDNPDISKPVVCLECCHGRSKHPKPGDVIAVSNKQGILDIFNAAREKTEESNSHAGTSRAEARAEMLLGLKKTRDEPRRTTKPKVSACLYEKFG
jgi:hypothetical protein